MESDCELFALTTKIDGHCITSSYAGGGVMGPSMSSVQNPAFASDELLPSSILLTVVVSSTGGKFIAASSPNTSLWGIGLLASTGAGDFSKSAAGIADTTTWGAKLLSVRLQHSDEAISRIPTRNNTVAMIRMTLTISWSSRFGEQSSQSPNKIYVRLASTKHPPMHTNPKTMAVTWSHFLHLVDRNVRKTTLFSGMIKNAGCTGLTNQAFCLCQAFWAILCSFRRYVLVITKAKQNNRKSLNHCFRWFHWRKLMSASMRDLTY